LAFREHRGRQSWERRSRRNPVTFHDDEGRLCSHRQRRVLLIPAIKVEEGLPFRSLALVGGHGYESGGRGRGGIERAAERFGEAKKGDGGRLGVGVCNAGPCGVGVYRGRGRQGDSEWEWEDPEGK
jgi:hypothetical protein